MEKISLAKKLSGPKDKWRSKKGRKRVVKSYFHRSFKLLVLLLLILVSWAIIQTPHFLATTPALAMKEPGIVIKGGYITKEEVYNLFKKFVLKKYSCLHPNIFKLDIRRIEEYLLSCANIKTVKVNRQLPHRIVIKVEGRTPVVKLKRGKGWLGIDEARVAFPIRDEFDLPVIVGLRKLTVGKEIKSQGLENMFLIRAQDQELGLNFWSKIQQIDLADNLRISIKTGVNIYFGHKLEEKRLQPRLKELNSVLRYFEEQGQVKEYIDVRFDNIIIKE